MKSIFMKIDRGCTVYIEPKLGFEDEKMMYAGKHLTHNT